jgi:S1-C subfamily serine protease
VLGLRGRRFVPARGDSPAGMLLTTPLHSESSAARAGLASGDLLVAVDGSPITDQGALDAALDGRGPGDVVVLTVVQTGATKAVRVTLQSDPTLELVTFEAAGLPVPDAVRAFRDAWAGSKVR